MEDLQPPVGPDPAQQLQRDIYFQVVHLLRISLPEPPTETTESLARRQRVAMARVAALVPANADEAELACAAVACSVHAMDALQEVVKTIDPETISKLRNQACRMGRDARGYRSTLMRMQATREKREEDEARRDAAAWTEHSTLGLMIQAAETLPPPVAKPPPALIAQQRQPRLPEPELSPEEKEEKARRVRLYREAEHYAIVNTTNARRIREARGIPADCDFEPPRPELLDAIMNGNGPNLRFADTYEPHPDVLAAKRRQAELQATAASTTATTT